MSTDAPAPPASDAPAPLRGLGRSVVLMYHDVVSPDGPGSGFEGPGPDVYRVDAGAFARHLARLPGGEPGVVLTFDDGGRSAHDPVAPLLEGRGLRGVFLVTTDLIGAPGFLTREQIADLDRRGHVIGSHTRSHPHRMSACTPAELAREWEGSIAALAEILGRPVRCASVAGGHYSDAVGRAAAAAGIETLFTSAPTRRVARVAGCRLVGRYVVTRSTSDDTVAALARGDARARARRSLAWRARAAARALAGPRYEDIRTAVLSRRR